jgi:glucosamine--fructose-6-phosphate aminotransferase (isomerizing)
MTSEMRRTMERQPEDLERILGETARIDEMAERLAERRVLLVGTGTSWHAAHQGAALLRLAGLEARGVASSGFTQGDPALKPGDAVVVLTHTGGKRHTPEALRRARAAGTPTVVISGLGVEDADLTTVARETSAAYTASHLGALARLAQLARALGAGLELERVPDAVRAALADARPPVVPPDRLLELIGGGLNRWTAAEGALKARETAYVATEGLDVEQFLHGPSVALRGTDLLVCLDGGGPWSERLREVAAAAERSGVRVLRVAASALGEPLSIFPLTVAVQRIALELAEALGTDPDSFGRDVPGREPWRAVVL